jgi:hypothetical protein
MAAQQKGADLLSWAGGGGVIGAVAIGVEYLRQGQCTDTLMQAQAQYQESLRALQSNYQESLQAILEALAR